MPVYVTLDFFQMNHKIKNKIQGKKMSPPKGVSLVIFHISDKN